MITRTYDILAARDTRMATLWLEQGDNHFLPLSVDSIQTTDSMIGDFVSKAMNIKINEDALVGFNLNSPFKVFQTFAIMGDSDDLVEGENVTYLGEYVIDTEESKYDKNKKMFDIVAVIKMDVFKEPLDVNLDEPRTPEETLIHLSNELSIDMDLLLIPGVTDKRFSELNYHIDGGVTLGQYIQAYAYLTMSNAYYDGYVVTFKSVLDLENPYEINYGDVVGDLSESETYKVTNIKYDSIEGVNDPIASTLVDNRQPIDGDTFYFVNNVFLNSYGRDVQTQVLDTMCEYLGTKTENIGLVYSTVDLSNLYVNASRTLNDVVYITMRDGTRVKTFITEFMWSYTPAMKGTLKCAKLENVEDHYQNMNPVRRNVMNMGITVDRVNQEIKIVNSHITDLNDKTSELTIEVDRIAAEVKSRGLGNIVYNINGSEGFDQWEQNGRAVLSETWSEIGLMEGMTLGASAIPVEIKDSLSYTGWSFLNPGEMISPFGFLLPRDVFSFKGRVIDFKPIHLNIYEFEHNKKEDIEVEIPIDDIVYVSDMGECDPYANTCFGGNISVFDFDLSYFTNQVPILREPDEEVTYVVNSELRDENEFLELTHFDVIGKSSQGDIVIAKDVRMGESVSIDFGPFGPYWSVTSIEISGKCDGGYMGNYDLNGTFTVSGRKYVFETISQYVPIKTTEFLFNTPGETVEATIQPQEKTRYVKLGFDIPSAKYNDPTILHEMMFNQGPPKDYFESTDDAIIFAESIREQLSNEIRDVVTEVDKITGDIYNTTVKITATQGVEIWSTSGKGLTVYDKDDQKSIELNTDGHMIARELTVIKGNFTDVNINGNLTAGEIGDWKVHSGEISSRDETIILNAKDEYIQFGSNRLSYLDNPAISILFLEGTSSAAHTQFRVSSDNMFGLNSVQAGNSYDIATIGTTEFGKGLMYLDGSNQYGLGKELEFVGENYNNLVVVRAELLHTPKIYIDGRIYELTRDASGYLKAT